MTSSVVGGGQRVDVGQCSTKCAEIRLHRLDRGLLQHDLGQPDAVGIGPHAGGKLARRNAPRQVAMVRVVPGEQRGGDAVVARRALLRGWLVSAIDPVDAAAELA